MTGAHLDGGVAHRAREVIAHAHRVTTPRRVVLGEGRHFQDATSSLLLLLHHRDVPRLQFPDRIRPDSENRHQRDALAGEGDHFVIVNNLCDITPAAGSLGGTDFRPDAGNPGDEGFLLSAGLVSGGGVSVNYTRITLKSPASGSGNGSGNGKPLASTRTSILLSSTSVSPKNSVICPRTRT